VKVDEERIIEENKLKIKIKIKIILKTQNKTTY